jgi:hypothetical protein
MSKLMFVLLQNTLVLVGIAGLYQLTQSNWAFLCIFLAQTFTSKGGNHE